MPEGSARAPRIANGVHASPPHDSAHKHVSGEALFIDDIIEPAETRGCLAAVLDSLATKRLLRPAKKHGNIPL